MYRGAFFEAAVLGFWEVLMREWCFIEILILLGSVPFAGVLQRFKTHFKFDTSWNYCFEELN